MKVSFALLLFACFAFSVNCLRRTYEIKGYLVHEDGKRESIKDFSRSVLEIENAREYSPLEAFVRSGSNRLIDQSVHGCDNCVFLLEFIPNDQEKKLYTSINVNLTRTDLVSGKNVQDFLEVAISENNDILSVKYGVNRVLNAGEQSEATEVKRVSLSQPLETPDVITDYVSGSTSFGKSQDGGAGAAAQPPQEEQSFFKKYMWWIIIGGFIVFQFFSVDKEKLMEAANQQAGGRR